MTSKELLYVKTIAEEKSISKAAKKLFIAQPSLSQSLQRIEETLGTPLFLRTPNGLSLSYAGERYYQVAAQILKMYEDFEIEISDINHLKTGRIHLGTTNHLGTLTLSRVLPEFRKRASNIELVISEENSAVLEQNLLSGKLSFAVMHAPKENPHPQLQYEVMKKDPFVIALSKDHPLVHRAAKKPGYPCPVLDIRELKTETFLMLHKQQRIRQVTDSVLARAGILQPHIGLTLRNFETALLLAAQGLGITLVPWEYSKIPRTGFNPVLFSIDDIYDANWDMCIASLKGSYLSKADQLFISLVKQEFSKPQ